MEQCASVHGSTRPERTTNAWNFVEPHESVVEPQRARRSRRRPRSIASESGSYALAWPSTQRPDLEEPTGVEQESMSTEIARGVARTHTKELGTLEVGRPRLDRRSHSSVESLCGKLCGFFVSFVFQKCLRCRPSLIQKTRSLLDFGASTPGSRPTPWRRPRFGWRRGSPARPPG